MTRRRMVFWGSLLILAAVWWWLAPADDVAACAAAAAAAGEADWGPNGLSLVPPGYRCLYIGGDDVVPLDLGGWLELIAGVAIPVLLLYGLVAFAVRRRRRRA